MDEILLKEWLQALLNEDFISYIQFNMALKKVNMFEYEEAKLKVLNFIQKDKTLTEYEKAEKLYGYIKENFKNGNTILSYKEILCS